MSACTKPSGVPGSSWTYLVGRHIPVEMSTAPRDSAHLATPLALKVEMERRETVGMELPLRTHRISLRS